MELEVLWAGRDPRPVGRLYQNDRGTVYFEYDPVWRAGSLELSPIYLPNATAGAVTTPTPAFGGLHGLFQDALPDWWGERLMQRYFEKAGIPWSRVTALRKLACQGEHKMGALSFIPSMDETDFNDSMLTDLGAMVESARRTLQGETGEVLEALMKTGMSPGGAQPKALLSISGDFREIRLDDPAPEGFTAWLVKFDMEPVLQEGRIEAAYADMARAAGLQVPETRLHETGNACHFMSRRFDRGPRGERVHLHSYSGLTHTPLRDGLEYGDLMEITRTLTRDHRCVEEFFRRAVFNVMASNDDDHGRNHAFLMDASGEWSLAPAFDLTLATYPLASGFRAARVNGKAINLNRNELLQLGIDHAVNKPTEILQQVADAVSGWETHAKRNGISPANIAMVASQHRVLL